MDSPFRHQIIRLAYTQPDLQPYLLPILASEKVAAKAWPDPLTNEQKAFLKDLAGALNGVLRAHVDGAKPDYFANTDYQTGKTYARDGFGRKSILAGVPHAHITVSINAVKDGLQLVGLPTVEFLLSADGGTAIVKADTPWGRGIKSMTSREIGVAWANDIVKRVEHTLRERQQAETRKQQEAVPTPQPLKPQPPKPPKSAPAPAVRPLTAQDLQAALKKLGVSSAVSTIITLGKPKLQTGAPFGVSIIWGQREKDIYWFLGGDNSAYGRDMPGNSNDYQGDLPLGTSADDLARVVKQALDKLLKAREVDDAEKAKAEDGQVWSVARTGYEVGGDAEDDNQGYVAEVETFNSKDKAIAYAKSIGGAAVIKGTQMWNEPMGQVEEHDRNAEYRYYR